MEPSARNPGQTSPGNVVRDLTERFQNIIDSMSRLGVSGRSDASNLIGQWISILETGTAVTALPVHQMRAVVAALRAQRDQVRALRSQLDAFDEQLTALDNALQPMLEMGEQWAQAQTSLLGRLREVTGAEPKDR